MPKSAIRVLRKEARARREIEKQLETEQSELNKTRERLLAEKLNKPAEVKKEESSGVLLQTPDTGFISAATTMVTPTTRTTQDVKIKTLQVTVQAGLMKQVPLEVQAGNYVEWGFSTKNGDIGFAVLLERPDGEVLTMVEDEKVQSHEMSIQGSLIIQESGRLWLQWDNSYSWMTNKDLQYSIKLLNKCPPSRQPSTVENGDVHSNGTTAAAPAVTALAATAPAAAATVAAASPTAGDPNKVLKIVFVLGPPGAGKGTQCALLSDEFGFPHLSAGDLLRDERSKPESQYRSLIDGYIRDGKIVPIEITVQLLLNAMRARPDAECFLIDGFPRNQDNLDGWARETGSSVDVKGILYFDCPGEVVTKRLLERGKTSERTDDNVESIQKRFTTFREDTMPIVKHFQKLGLVCKVSTDRAVENIFADLKQMVDALVFKNGEQPKQLKTVAAAALQQPHAPAKVEPKVLDIKVKVPPAQPLTTATATVAAAAGNASITTKPITDASPSSVLDRKTPLRVILGTMTFTGQTNVEDSLEMMNIFAGAKCVREHFTTGRMEIDTARAYNFGEGETLIGDILNNRKDLKRSTFVATKANCFPGMGDTLRPESVTAQLAASLKALQLKSVDVLYLHNPDHNTDLKVTLEACNKLFEAGKFRELGLSNYTAWETVQAYYICKENGWVKPSLYQGMYNAITRDVERELLPALKKLGIRFYAYNPLAGGMLTGKHMSIANVPADDSRFSSANPWGTKYRERYWTKEHFAALDALQKACEAKGLTMTDASIAWMMNHSQLKGGLNDGVILGASKIEHLKQNLDAVSIGRLPQSVLDAVDQAWEICRPVCPSYWR